MASNENLPPKVLNALAKELKALEESPLEDIQIIFNDDNFSIIHADIDGPFGTPYEGGIFRVKLTIGQGFPEAPPKGYFVTRIFHPNIAKNGEICVNTLKKDWAPTLGLRHVLLAIRCLLIEPFPESALNEEAGKLLMEDYEAYAKHTRLMTSIHAMKHKSRAKSEMSESTAVNAWLARSESCARASLGKNSSSRDTALDGESDASGGKSPNSSFSPCAKKLKGETGSTPSVEKKKGDLRKRGLRRL